VYTLSTLASPGSAFGGPSVTASPPINGDPADDNLQKPPPTVFEGSGAGPAAGAAWGQVWACARWAGCGRAGRGG
jgi:hypothetical protein